MAIYLYAQRPRCSGCGPPAMFLICEAENSRTANMMAERLGAYFDGVGSRVDCRNCGDRWTRQTKAIPPQTIEGAVRFIYMSNPPFTEEAIRRAGRLYLSMSRHEWNQIEGS
jgi:hypothetical protein